MQCVILAGGLGTRMWPRSRTVPKTLLPVAGRPFAHWQLSWLAAAGVTSVVYSIGHLGDQVRRFVGDGSAWQLDVSYADEGATLRGTAGALRLALEQGLLDDRFLVLYGDSWLQVDPRDVVDAHTRSSLPALMTVFENRGRWDRSNAVVVGDRVTCYEKDADPRPPGMRWIDYGLSVLTRQVVEELVGRDLPRDLAPVLSELARTDRLAAFEVTERFYEIGSPDGLADLESHLTSLTAGRRGYSFAR
jgi:NDP-sugar pyrophosphorylase family protein